MLQNFSWIVPARLAGMGWPGSGSLLSAAVKELGAEGVGLVVPSTREPIEHERVEAAGLQWLHVPVRDFAAPSPEQLETFVRAVDEIADAASRAHGAPDFTRTHAA